MHNFGKLAASREDLDITDPEGNVIGNQAIQLLHNANGVEWHDLFPTVPNIDHYLITEADGTIISMEADAEHSQLAGYNIIGISDAERGGFTRGEGGTVYGKLWNGTAIVEKPFTRVDYPALTPKQFRRALVLAGISIASVVAAIAGIPDEQARELAEIDWEYATSFERLDSTLVNIAAALGMSDEVVDQLWLNA